MISGWRSNEAFADSPGSGGGGGGRSSVIGVQEFSFGRAAFRRIGDDPAVERVAVVLERG